MSTFQQVTILGHLGDNPTVKRFDSGGIVANIPVATSESWVDKQSNEKKTVTEWHKVTAYGKTAELIEKYCAKGDKILITGKLKTRKWQDAEGKDRWTTEIIVDTIVFTGKAQQEGTSSAPAAAPAPATDFKEEDHDDLPF